jgi:hypothetical protein
MSPAGGRGCVPAYDRALLRDRLPKNHWQSPASSQGPPAAPQGPTAAGYYAETGTGRDSSTYLLPPLRFTKEGRVWSGHRRPQHALVSPMGRGTPTGPPPTVTSSTPVGGNGSRHSQWEQSGLNFGCHQSHQPSFSGVRDGGSLILW